MNQCFHPISMLRACKETVGPTKTVTDAILLRVTGGLGCVSRDTARNPTEPNTARAVAPRTLRTTEYGCGQHRARQLEAHLSSAITVATKLYRALRDRMAAILDVYTTTGSSVTPKTAGMESTAKMTSDISMTASTTKRGVTFQMFSSWTKNLSPRYSGVTVNTCKPQRCHFDGGNTSWRAASESKRASASEL